MNFKNAFFISVLSIQLYTPQLWALRESDPVSAPNHHSNLEFYEFSNLATLGNIPIFFDKKADRVKLSCPSEFLKGKSLKIVLTDENKRAVQFVEMKDCVAKLTAALEIMMKNPLSKKFSIVFDQIDKVSKTEYYKFLIVDIDSPNEIKARQNYIDTKLETTLGDLIL